MNDSMLDDLKVPESGLLLPLFTRVLLFTDLETILLTSDSSLLYKPTHEYLEKLRKMLAGYLEHHKEKFTRGVAPIVKARQYQDLYTGEKAFV